MSESEHRIPVTEEVLAIGKREVLTDRMRVETRTTSFEEIAEAALARTDVEVSRVPVGREVDSPPPVRTEGDVTIIPILEERMVIERRLVLREEVHLKRRRTVETVSVPVELRRQEVVVSRDELDAGPDTSEGSTMND